MENFEEPIGECITIKLDQHIGSPTLTHLYRKEAKLSRALINSTQYHQLFRKELRTHQTPKLIFRASRDGFSDSDFHKHCDDQGKIVIILKSKCGDLFGGYTSESMKLDERGMYVKDEEMFTFRFDNNRLCIFRLLPEDRIYALYRYSSFHLFAFGYCFWIGTNANTSATSGSHDEMEDHIFPECKLLKKEGGNQVNEYGELLENQYFPRIGFLIEDLEVYKLMD
ncbi:predicted protein [Naegleria gruberi]|uniref:Predicted protein n=1 Tax=Naegleria gruberi TaxID=5762 RepID=D2VTZ8_NAEGR|nr:uncharacterized protein NAEGRDRAFT_72485 [Naegleria gruberi]EFC39808.1 predicted protein [Naegleria gruberi]|eukprot:XP_002672552.1 predicted protein [Naegleria gruberi strain NEG-M]